MEVVLSFVSLVFVMYLLCLGVFIAFSLATFTLDVFVVSTHKFKKRYKDWKYKR